VIVAAIARNPAAPSPALEVVLARFFREAAHHHREAGKGAINDPHLDIQLNEINTVVCRLAREPRCNLA